MLVIKKTEDVVVINRETGVSDPDDKKYYHFKADRELVDQATQVLTKVVGDLASEVIPQLGAGAAAGTAAAGAFKATAGMPPLQRLATTGAISAVAAGGYVIGASAGRSIVKNAELSEEIKSSRHGDPNPDRIPSPDPDLSINSPLEELNTGIPLVSLLINSITLDLLEIILIIILIYLLCYSYLNTNLIKFISNVLNNYNNVLINNIKNILSKGQNVNDKFIKYILTFVIVVLLLLKLLHIVVNADILYNIDSYVTVYNHLKKSMLIIITTSPASFGKEK